MRKLIYPLLSICYGVFAWMPVVGFAVDGLEGEVTQKYDSGAPYSGVGCPSGMCGDYSEQVGKNPSWPVSNQTEEEVVSVQEEPVASVQNQPPADQAVVYQEENQPIEPERSGWGQENSPQETAIESDEEPIQNYEQPRSAPSSASGVAPYYMRLDFGMTIGDADAEFKPVACDGTQLLACTGLAMNKKQTFVRGTYGDAFSKGIGVGLNINSFLRLDLTIAERSDFDFSEDKTARGQTAHFDTVAVDNIGDPYDDFYDRDMEVSNTLQNMTGMASLYIDFFRRYSRDDLGRLSRSAIAPYIGVGVGYARTVLEDMTGAYTMVYDSDGLGGTAPAYLDGIWRLQGETSSGLAWQATAGLAFALSEKTWLDISYRYVDLGTIQTSPRYTITMDTDLNNDGISGNVGDLDIDGQDADGDGNPADPGYMEYDDAGAQEFDLTVQEVSIGLRYEF